MRREILCVNMLKITKKISRGRIIHMELSYEKIFEIEIINALSSSVYNRVLIYLLNHELDIENTSISEVNLLNQLEIAQNT